MLPVYLHTLAECALPARLREGNVTLQALGDFGASNESAEVLAIAAAGTSLRFPLSTRAVEARIDAGASRFSGYGERLERHRYDVVLWPEREACRIFRPDGAQGYPGTRGGQAFGFSRRHGLLLAAGGNDPLLSDAIVGALTFDVNSGAIRAFDSSDDSVLREARAFATVTESGDELLVAGGENPVFGVPEEDLDLRRTAEIFDPRRGEFSAESIELREPRTRHAAVTLRDGRSLLVGGRSRYQDEVVAQRRSERLDPERRRADYAATISERIEPRALLLSDGRVFVGGGYDRLGKASDPAGEWLRADGEHELSGSGADHTTRSLPPRFDRAFVAMPGGGVLAAGGCADRAPETPEEAAECRAACVRGCPPAPDSTHPSGYDAFWLDSEGNEHALPRALAGIAAPRPILLPGSDGSPWLIAATEEEPERPRLFRFDPWSQRFSAADVPPELRLPRPGFPLPIAIDPDAFVWLDESERHGELYGLRLGTRNRYTRDLALVLASDPDDPRRPLHLVPDRPLRDEERYDGRLRLLPGGASVWVADADYGDVTLRITLLEPPSAPPIVVLGGVELGGGACAWPGSGAPATPDAAIATLSRRGTQVELEYRGERRRCAVPEGRLSVALRAPDGPSVISELELQRGAPPAN